MDNKLEVLLLGCGTFKQRKLQIRGRTEDFSDSNVTTIDVDPNCNPTIVMDLDGLGKDGKRLPFEDDTFDEIGAYNCLEHFGRQGDWRGYFLEFEEYHRVLKPGGLFCIIVPNRADYFADPGHTRFFDTNHFGFLNQDFYEQNREANTCFTDYRHVWKKNFALYEPLITEAHIAVVLVKA